MPHKQNKQAKMRRKNYVNRNKNKVSNPKSFKQHTEEMQMNPQINAKCCLLEISEEGSKLLPSSSTSFDNPNFRSYSTEFFSLKKSYPTRAGSYGKNEFMNISAKGQTLKDHQMISVTKKSTHSNEMRKTTSLHLKMNKNRMFEHNELKVQDQCKNNNNNDMPCHNTHTSFFSFICNDGKLNDKFENIFSSKPSKHLIELLKRTSVTRGNKQDSENASLKESRQKINDTNINIMNTNPRKKSLFRFKNLITKGKGQCEVNQIEISPCVVEKIDELNIKMVNNAKQMSRSSQYEQNFSSQPKIHKKDYFSAVIRLDDRKSYKKQLQFFDKQPRKVQQIQKKLLNK